LAFCILYFALLLAACGGGQPSAQQPSPGPTSVAAPSAAPAATSVPPTPTLGPGQFRNPVIDRDFPDPDLLKVGDSYYAYATNAGTVNIQSARSNDLVHWEMLGAALPSLPDWARPVGGLTWAPEVTSYGDRYIMYFTTRDDKSDRQCIGVAASDTPEGPFQSPNPQPLICQTDQGGSIDASAFADDDGTRYVLWKNDGNCCGMETWLYIQKTSADGLKLEGEPARLIKRDQPWEGALVEAPTLWKHDGKYYLFYSANNYAGPDYAIGYAVADAVTGPYRKPADQPLLATDYKNRGAIGPGGQDIVLDKDGETWLVYHSWERTATYRAMQIDELVWEGDTPVVKGPDKVPQAVP
jgi:beta-xylosidase